MIAGDIEKEALLISALGVLAGFLMAVAGKFLITRLTPISVELEPLWLFYALRWVCWRERSARFIPHSEPRTSTRSKRSLTSSTSPTLLCDLDL